MSSTAQFSQFTSYAPPLDKLQHDGGVGDPRHSVPQKRFMLIVEDDENHTFPYVIEILRTVCGYDRRRAYRLTNQIHFQGEAIVWIGEFDDVARMASEIRSFGPDRFSRVEVTTPLTVRYEAFDRD